MLAQVTMQAVLVYLVGVILVLGFIIGVTDRFLALMEKRSSR